MWATPGVYPRATLLTLLLAVCELAYGGTVHLPEEVKNGLLTKHNDLRSKANSKTKLKPLTWNDKLESLAGKVAGKCVFGKHSDAGANGIPGTKDWRHNKTTNGFAYVGENAAFASMKDYVNADLADGWGNEKADYNIVTNKCAKSKVCGHYTQQVWNSTTDVGCAFSDCPNQQYKTFLYCEYGPGGNMRGQWPYVPAEPASTTESYSNRTSSASTHNVPNKSPHIVTASMIFTLSSFEIFTLVIII